MYFDCSFRGGFFFHKFRLVLPRCLYQVISALLQQLLISAMLGHVCKLLRDAIISCLPIAFEIIDVVLNIVNDMPQLQ